MAELILKVGTQSPDPGWQDGDIIHAVDDRWIHRVHAQHICHVKFAVFNGDGLRPAGSLAEMYLSHVKQFKIERVSKTEIRRINQWESTQEILSDNPNAQGQTIDVIQYLGSAVLHPRHHIFGTKGHEIWYAGRTLTTVVVINNIWTEIEARTMNKKTDFGEWPLGVEDKKAIFAISVDNLDSGTRLELESEVKDDKQNLLKRRKYKVTWRSLPGLTQESIDDIQNIFLEVDLRKSFSFNRSQIVETKQ